MVPVHSDKSKPIGMKIENPRVGGSIPPPGTIIR